MRKLFNLAKVLLVLVPAAWAQTPVTKSTSTTAIYKILWQKDAHKCTYVAVSSPADPVVTVIGRDSFTVYVDNQNPGYEPHDIQALNFASIPRQAYTFVSKTNAIGRTKVPEKTLAVMKAFQTGCDAIQRAVKSGIRPDLTTPPTPNRSSFVSVSKSGAIIFIALQSAP